MNAKAPEDPFEHFVWTLIREFAFVRPRSDSDKARWAEAQVAKAQRVEREADAPHLRLVPSEEAS